MQFAFFECKPNLLENETTSHHHALLRLQKQILAVVLAQVAGVLGAGPRLRLENYKWRLSLQFEVQQQLQVVPQLKGLDDIKVPQHHLRRGPTRDTVSGQQSA